MQDQFRDHSCAKQVKDQCCAEQVQDQCCAEQVQDHELVAWGIKILQKDAF